MRKIRNPFKKEQRDFSSDVISYTESLISALVTTDSLTDDKVMCIPTVKSCVEFISSTIAMLPIKLYKEVGGETQEVRGDIRTKLLNDETGDTLNGFEMKKAFVKDYLLNGAGYIYINKQKNETKSLHYVDYGNVSELVNADAIFKKLELMVQGATYYDWQFIRLTKNIKNGCATGGIVKDNAELLSVVYNTLLFEQYLVKNGGNKKGFLKSEKRLDTATLDALKTAWANLYANNQNNMMILNGGIDFKESSNTSVEMQLNENKTSNALEICKIFNVSEKVISGNCTDDEYSATIKTGIIPPIMAIQTALNKTLLLENEKQSFYFAIDTTELLKGDILKRYQAYEIALRSNFIQLDEVRYKEDLKPIGFNYIKLGLQDVLLNPETKEIYTPNMNATANLGNLGGGEKIEN